MKLRRLVVLVYAAMLTVLGCLPGCGSGGSTPTGPSFSVTASGNGVYQLQGSSLGQVAGVRLDVTYDSALLGSPSVVAGDLATGAAFAANTAVAGKITLAAIKLDKFSPNGTLATISFATHTGSPPLSLTVSELIDANGNTIQ